MKRMMGKPMRGCDCIVCDHVPGQLCFRLPVPGHITASGTHGNVSGLSQMNSNSSISKIENRGGKRDRKRDETKADEMKTRYPMVEVVFRRNSSATIANVTMENVNGRTAFVSR